MRKFENISKLYMIFHVPEERGSVQCLSQNIGHCGGRIEIIIGSKDQYKVLQELFELPSSNRMYKFPSAQISWQEVLLDKQMISGHRLMLIKKGYDNSVFIALKFK